MLLKKYFYSFFFFVSSLSFYGQLQVLTGTSVNIAPGTTISINSPTQDTLKIASGASVVNNGIILLGQSVVISEQSGFPISGNGYEQYSNVYSSPLLGTEPGGLGLRINTTGITDSLTIQRTHLPLTNSGISGISRVYKVISENNSGLGADVDFYYDPIELNGNVSNDLNFYQSFDGGTSWFAVAGSSLSNHVLTEPGDIDSFSLMSLFSFSFRIDSLNALSFYHGDTIKVYYTLNGTLNPGNTLKFEFSDTAGNFSAPFVLDSIPAANGSGILIKSIPASLDPDNEYRLRLKTTDLALISADNGSDIVILPQLSSSIVTNKNSNVYQVYPNPASERCFIKGADIRRIRVTDKLGREIIDVSCESNSSIIELPLSGLPAALYLVSIETSDKIFHSKFIKN
jgi:hypothetical protein